MLLQELAERRAPLHVRKKSGGQRQRKRVGEVSLHRTCPRLAVRPLITPLRRLRQPGRCRRVGNARAYRGLATPGAKVSSIRPEID